MNKNEEIVLKHLLNLPQNKYEANHVRIGAGQYNIERLTPEQTISILLSLQDQNYIQTHFYGSQSSDSVCEITLTASSLNYFEHQQTQTKTKIFSSIWDFIKFITPTIISIIALLKSYDVV